MLRSLVWEKLLRSICLLPLGFDKAICFNDNSADNSFNVFKSVRCVRNKYSANCWVWFWWHKHHGPSLYFHQVLEGAVASAGGSVACGRCCCQLRQWGLGCTVVRGDRPGRSRWPRRRGARGAAGRWRSARAACRLPRARLARSPAAARACSLFAPGHLCPNFTQQIEP